MKLHRLVLTSLALFFFIACAGDEQRPPEIAQGPDTPGGRYEAEEAAPPPPMAPSPDSAARGSGAAEAEDDAMHPRMGRRRPGLATQWGEERESHVHEVSFQRNRPHLPAGSLSLRYDDEQGIEAATGYSTDDAYPRTFPVRGGAITVSITDDDGDPLPALHANGRDYVIGDRGDRYQIRVKNRTAGRFEIVTSVDGLDVLDGQEGSFDKRGYLVSPWSTLTIEGFRDSYDTVRAFRFGDVETSYAARRGKARNVGVIGVAVFEERGFRWGYDGDEIHRRETADPFPGRFAPAP